MPDLVPVHGGLDAPVSRTRSALAPQVSSSPRPPPCRASSCRAPTSPPSTASPTARSRRSKGPMDEETWHSVLDHDALEFGFRRYAWTAPISFPVTDAEAKQLRVGHSAALVFEGDIVGVLRVSSIFDWDKAKHVETLLRHHAHRPPGRAHDHGRPAHARWSAAICGRCRSAVDPEYGSFVLSPRQVRTLIAERRWERALAFQTRNPLHRAHEYALVAGVEQLTRLGYFAGVVLNPLIGELKGDDVPARVRMRCYRDAARRAAARQGRQGRGAVARARLRSHRGVRAGRARHQDALRRPEGSRDARHLPAEPRLHRHRHRPQARRRAHSTTAARSGATSTPRRSSTTCAAACTSARATSASPPTTTAPAAST